MQKIRLFTVVLFFGLNACGASTSTLKPGFLSVETLNKTEKEYILFVTHPTQNVLESMVALVHDKMLDIKYSNFRIVGLFHANESHRYRQSQEFLKKIGDKRFSLMRLSCPLKRDALFKENSCSNSFRKLVKKSIGIIFTGGADIPPELYGEETLLTSVLATPKRQYWELSFLAHLLGTSRNPNLKPILNGHKDYMVLGICMGMQGMNVATGGSLYQDIPSELYGVKTFEAIKKLDTDHIHRRVDFYIHRERGLGPGHYHHLRFNSAQDFWQRILPKEERSEKGPLALSIHHQALKTIGQDLEVIATSTDGKVVEAIRHKKYKSVLGLQFHPEYYWRDRWIYAKKFKAQPIGDRLEDKESESFYRNIWQLISQRLVKQVAQ